MLSSDGKSLLNLWFIPHYTEVKREHSMGDQQKAWNKLLIDAAFYTW